MIIYQYKTCVGARTKEELNYKTEQILVRLKKAGMTVNKDKCNFDCKKISYLGYQISKGGISPNDRLTKKITEIVAPTNKKELESFLGLINFYRKYIPRYSDVIEPFTILCKKIMNLSGHKSKLALLKH